MEHIGYTVVAVARTERRCNPPEVSQVVLQTLSPSRAALVRHHVDLDGGEEVETLEAVQECSQLLKALCQLVARKKAAVSCEVLPCPSNSPRDYVRVSVSLDSHQLMSGVKSPAAAAVYRELLQTQEEVELVVQQMESSRKIKEYCSLVRLFQQLPSTTSRYADALPPLVPSAPELGAFLLGLLPQDTLLNVVSHLDLKDVARLRSTCRYMRDVCWMTDVGMRLRLFPHQRSAVRWMLDKEKRLAATEDPTVHRLTLSQDNVTYASLVDGSSSLELGDSTQVMPTRGGFFCDEPGLGKTITCIRLILSTLHTLPVPPDGVKAEYHLGEGCNKFGHYEMVPVRETYLGLLNGEGHRRSNRRRDIPRAEDHEGGSSPAAMAGIEGLPAKLESGRQQGPNNMRGRGVRPGGRAAPKGGGRKGRSTAASRQVLGDDREHQVNHTLVRNSRRGPPSQLGSPTGRYPLRRSRSGVDHGKGTAGHLDQVNGDQVQDLELSNSVSDSGDDDVDWCVGQSPSPPRRLKRSTGGCSPSEADDSQANGGVTNWVACDNCKKWRRLPGGTPVPSGPWFCAQHPDPSRSSCSAPEDREEPEEKLQCRQHAGFYHPEEEAPAKLENIEYFKGTLSAWPGLRNALPPGVWTSCPWSPAITWLARQYDPEVFLEAVMVPPGYRSPPEYVSLFETLGLVQVQVEPKKKHKGASRGGGSARLMHTWCQPHGLHRLRLDLEALREALRYLEGVQAPSERMYLSPATLVVVPMTLIPHWLQQISSYVRPGLLRVHVLADGGDLPPQELAWQYDVVLTTFNRLSAEGGGSERNSLLKRVHWLRIMLDEGHTLGASLTMTNKLFTAIELRAERRWVTTGTPTPRTSSSSLPHLQPLLAFLHQRPWGLSKVAWENVVQKPFEAGNIHARARLLHFLQDNMIRASKADLMMLPPCHIKVVLLDFAPDHAESYNALVEVIHRNLLLADWFDDTHRESLICEGNSKWAKEMMNNVRLSCCVAGATNLTPKEKDLWETLCLVAERQKLVPPPAFPECVWMDKRPSNKRRRVVHMQMDPDKGEAAASTSGSGDVENAGILAATTSNDVVLENRLVPQASDPNGVPLGPPIPPFLPPDHPLSLVETSLLSGGSCQACGGATRLPLITPCGHVACLECVTSHKTECPVPTCHQPYVMQSIDDPARLEVNTCPKWEVPVELIEWQPVYHQVGAQGKSGGEWSARWEITHSTKCVHLLQRLYEVGAAVPPMADLQEEGNDTGMGRGNSEADIHINMVWGWGTEDPGPPQPPVLTTGGTTGVVDEEVNGEERAQRDVEGTRRRGEQCSTSAVLRDDAANQGPGFAANEEAVPSGEPGGRDSVREGWVSEGRLCSRQGHSMEVKQLPERRRRRVVFEETCPDLKDGVEVPVCPSQPKSECAQEGPARLETCLVDGAATPKKRARRVMFAEPEIDTEDCKSRRGSLDVLAESLKSESSLGVDNQPATSPSGEAQGPVHQTQEDSDRRERPLEVDVSSARGHAKDSEGCQDAVRSPRGVMRVSNQQAREGGLGHRSRSSRLPGEVLSPPVSAHLEPEQESSECGHDALPPSLNFQLPEKYEEAAPQSSPAVNGGATSEAPSNQTHLPNLEAATGPSRSSHPRGILKGAGQYTSPEGWVYPHPPTSKAIIFSQFWTHIQLISAHLKAHKVQFALLKRGLPAREKQQVASSFRTNPHLGVLLMDETGALGLDLSFVEHVFLMEPIADRSLQEQVISRAHRMGASKAVHVEVIAMRNTAEEHMVAMAHMGAKPERSGGSQEDNGLEASDATTLGDYGGILNQVDNRRSRNRLLLDLKKVVVADLPAYQDLELP